MFLQLFFGHAEYSEKSQELGRDGRLRKMQGEDTGTDKSRKEISHLGVTYLLQSEIHPLNLQPVRPQGALSGPESLQLLISSMEALFWILETRRRPG